MNADPEVMRFFPAPLTREQSLTMAERIRRRIDEDGFGLWAVEMKTTSAFIGFVGITQQDLGFEWTPCIEIGWRLAAPHWGHGYATEAASAVLDDALNRFPAVYSFTAELNLPSQKVMQKIGLHRRADLDFDHPRIESGPLRRHIVYASTPLN
jgi:RimJ/RimL family protein N-acetyltransferase